MSKIPGPPVGYTDLLDYATKEKIKANSERSSSFPLRPSASGFCARRLAYDLMEFEGHDSYEKEPIQPNVYRLLNLGHSIEYALIKDFYLIPNMKIKYKQQAVTLFKLDELKGQEAKIIEGQVDLVLWSDEWKCVADVKSAKDSFSKAYPTRWQETLDKFDNLKTTQKISDTAWYIEDLPAFLDENNDAFLANNLYQLNLYCMSPFFQERGISHGSILKYNKNDSRLYELRFKPSVELFEKVKDKFNKVNKAVAKKKPHLVEKDFVIGSSSCSFCPYKTQCWPEQDAKKAYFKTLPQKRWPKDTHKIARGNELEELFEEFQDKDKAIKDRDALEEKIIKMMLEEKVNKIRLANNKIYELKHLKSPRPHFELRLSKL